MTSPSSAEPRGRTEGGRTRVFGAAILTLAFGSGFGILVLEIAGARLLAPIFGLSTIPWTAVIAVVLTGLALGNGIGGRLADRELVPLSWLFILAGFAALVPLLWTGLPGTAMVRFGFLQGALIAALILFGAPSFLMGCATPYLIRLDTGSLDEVGRRAGDVGAWATGGSIVGTLAAGFVFIPAFPLHQILAGVAASFFLFAALAGGLEGSRLRALVSLVLVLVPFAALKASGERHAAALFTTETQYASIQVRESEWYPGVPVRELWQNGSLSSAEIRATGEPAHRYQIAAGWLLEDRIDRMEHMLQLGGAANTFPVALKRWKPSLDVTVVEIDPRVVTVARDYFAYGSLPPDALRMVVDDARPFLNRDQGSYDLIHSDAYDHLYSIPWILMTREAFQAMERRLKPDGVVFLTLSTSLEGPGLAFLARVVGTVESVFPAVRVFRSDLEPSESTIHEVIVTAARHESFLPERPALEYPVQGEGPIFTDLFAPVEYLQLRRILADPAWN